MFSRNSFGSFYPVDSIIHRLNPVTKILYFLFIIGLSIFCKSFNLNAMVLGIVLVMVILSFVPINYYFNSIWALRYIYILIAFGCAYFRMSMDECIAILFKISSIVLYLNVFSYTTSPSESAYGIEKFFANSIFISDPEFSFEINNSLRYFPLLVGIQNRTLKAASSRGMDYYNANIIEKLYIKFKTFSRVNRLVELRNKEVALNQELKLFNLKKKRSNYRSNKFAFNDFFFLFLFLVIAYLCCMEAGIL